MEIYNLINPALFWTIESVSLAGLIFAYARLARKVMKGEKV